MSALKEIEEDGVTVVSNLSWMIGVGLAVGATGIGTLGRIFMRWSHVLKESDFQKSRRVLLIGVLFLIINPSMDVLSLAFASPTLLTPLAGTTLVWNVILAHVVLKEHLTVYAVGGSAVALLGCILVGIFGPKDDPKFEDYDEVMQLWGRQNFHIYAVCQAILLTLFGTLISVGNSFIRGVSYALVAGTFSGLFFSLKCSVELIRIGATHYFVTYIIILSAAATPLIGIIVLYFGLKEYDALILLPIYHAALVLTGTTSSAIFFKDLEGLKFYRAIIFSIAIGIIIIGAVIVSIHGLAIEHDEEKTGLLSNSKDGKSSDDFIISLKFAEACADEIYPTENPQEKTDEHDDHDDDVTKSV